MNYDPIRADIFSLAMNIVSVLNEKRLDHCYDYTRKHFYS